jgi:hypothetical protein
MGKDDAHPSNTPDRKIFSDDWTTLGNDWLRHRVEQRKETSMKKRTSWALAGLILVASILVVCTSQAEEAKITVLNPRGQPPQIPLVPMAPRLNTLDGKTVYFVDIRFVGGSSFLHEMMNWFAETMPNVKTVFREKRGPYMDNDPQLWAEIKEKGDAMIMAIGH